MTNEKIMTDKTQAPNETIWSRRRFVLLTALIATLATIGGVALLINIFEHRQEGKNPFYRVVDLNDETEDPAIWGKNFPLQYDDYKRTVDMVRTRFGGSEAEPRTPTSFDPRHIVAQSKIEEDPRLKTMWAGYAFSKDFREERGHAFMLDDQTFTERPVRRDFTAASARTIACRPSWAVTGSGWRWVTAWTKAASSAR